MTEAFRPRHPKVTGNAIGNAKGDVRTDEGAAIVSSSGVSRSDADPLTVRLAAPRGFCAGVSRAIQAVEDALALHGAPVYVRHEIVHNAHVVSRLRAMGAVFIDELADAPGDRPVVLSAHGAPQTVYDEAKVRDLDTIDATCPLVLKVHNETRRNAANGRHVVLIGHANHPEVVGTLGQAPEGAVTLIETEEEARTADLPPGPYAYVTQTTLSVDDTAAIVAALKQRLPDIVGPRTADICYATSNRQTAVKAIAEGCDAVLVVGDPTSSNSNRLVETALSAGAKTAALIDDPARFDPSRLKGHKVIGITAGASAPEDLVEALIGRIAEKRPLTIDNVRVAEEDVAFKQPLMPAARARSEA